MAIHHWAVAGGVLSFALPTLAQPIVCPPGDNSIIQACLDRARPGDELVFAGDYRIDPSKPPVVLQNASHVRLVADAAEPPVFRCSVGANGRPLSAAYVNDGILLRADGGHFENILVAGLAFEGCATAINVFTANEGSFSNLEIREAIISNAYYGVIVDAPIERLVIRGSRMLNVERGIAIGSESLNESSGVEITGNTLLGLAPEHSLTFDQVGIVTSEMRSGMIARNTISGFSRSFEIPGIGVAAVNIGGPTELDIVHNVIQDVGVGISLSGPAEAQGSVRHNWVGLASTAGVVVRAGANHRRIGTNELFDNALDVRLTGVEAGEATSDNVVELLCGQTHEDFGIDNRLVLRHH